MDIEYLVSKLKTMPNCVVHPPSGLPIVEEGLVLPFDMTDFYQLRFLIC